MLIKQDAVKREVLEETGIKMKVLSLVKVQINLSRKWIRFVYLGHVEGRCIFIQVVGLLCILKY